MMDGFSQGFASVGTDGADPHRPARGRDSVFVAAVLQLQGEEALREVRIRNLSAGGMMAELDREVRIDTPVMLEMRGIGRVTGKVAWSAAGRIGIALDAPIDPKRARKPVGGGTMTPIYAKPL